MQSLPHWEDIAPPTSAFGSSRSGGGNKRRQSTRELDKYTRRSERALTESALFHFDTWSSTSEFSGTRNTPYISRAYGTGTQVFDYMLQRDWGVPSLHSDDGRQDPDGSESIVTGTPSQNPSAALSEMFAGAYTETLKEQGKPVVTVVSSETEAKLNAATMQVR
jgi:hypothetical protein